MIYAGAGQSSHGTTQKAVEEAAGAAMAQAGGNKGGGVLVFFTGDYAAKPEPLINGPRRTTGKERGLCSSGGGNFTQKRESEGSQGLGVLVLSSDQIQSNAFLFKPLRERDQEIGHEIANAGRRRGEGSSLLILLPDTYNGQPQPLLQSLHEGAGFVPVVGAGSSESGMARATYQLCGDEVTTNSVAGMHLSGSFDAAIHIPHACQPITYPQLLPKPQP